MTYSVVRTFGSPLYLPRKVLFSRDSQLLVIMSSWEIASKFTNRDDSVHIHNLLTWKEDVWRMNQKAHVSDIAFSGNSEFLYVLCSVPEERILYTIQISHHMNLICCSIMQL